MKKLSLFLIFIISFTTLAHAHETVKGSTATMFVHIDPVEPPVVGTPATIFINLTNSEKSFAVKDCDCNLTISHDDTVLLAVPLEASDDPEAFGIKPVPMTFMTEGQYDLTVTGSSKNGVVFQPFTLDEDIDVLPIGTTSQAHSHADHTSPLHFLHLALLWGGIAASTLVIYRERKEIFKKK